MREVKREGKRAPDEGAKNRFMRLVVVTKHSSIREDGGGCKTEALEWVAKQKRGEENREINERKRAKGTILPDHHW